MNDFPEQTYPVILSRSQDYHERIVQGKNRLKGLTTLICCLARDIEGLLPQTIGRLEWLGKSFKDYAVYVFENDSNDGTLPILQRWARSNPKVTVESEKLGYPLFSQIVSADRRNKMAFYRNKYMEYLDSIDRQYDIMTVMDMDMLGISMDGVYNTFGYEFDMMGSFGLWYRPAGRRNRLREQVHFDADAYREIGHPHVHDYAYVHKLGYKRGHPPVPVLSCFGGLGFYDMQKVRGLRYEGGDCEHVIFHRKMNSELIFMNPSMITLYRKH